MKNFRIADKWEVVISKDLFFTLAQEAYWHTKFAIEHAADRLEAMNQLQSYIWIKNCVKAECKQNKINYKNYIIDQEKAFADLIDEKFPLAEALPNSEDSDIITDGRVPF
ncbi:MAG: hypothetical protein K2H29_04925 [Oscillospiraceae bacterium]|nr:hypothetical protein [Oscillospiraceae bacterium]MDE5884405.1 hypothetical protein [Oscillospiraceae bacterium]